MFWSVKNVFETFYEKNIREKKRRKFENVLYIYMIVLLKYTMGNGDGRGSVAALLTKRTEPSRTFSRLYIRERRAARQQFVF